MSDCRKCADFEWCKEHEECGLFKPKPITNYDSIIRKTPEALAEFLAEYRCVHKAPHCMEANCAQCWLDWLREEADHD